MQKSETMVDVKITEPIPVSKLKEIFDALKDIKEIAFTIHPHPNQSMD